MNLEKHTIRRTVAAIAVSATAALLVVPLAQAGMDDWYRSTAPEPQPAQVGSTRTDAMYRDSMVSAQTAAAQADDHILDVSARDARPVSSGDHVLDVSARDYGTGASPEATPAGGTDWQKIGIDVGLGIGGALLLVALVVGVIEVRHTRHRLGSA